VLTYSNTVTDKNVYTYNCYKLINKQQLLLTSNFNFAD